MFTDIKAMLDQEEIIELLSYSVFPDPDQLQQTIDDYHTNSNYQLYGLASEGDWLGIIGYEKQEHNIVEIRHISVRPDVRHTGYGRGMILEVIGVEHPSQIIAETDEEAIDFYRNIGFTVESIGELNPGIERYRCTYIVDER